MKFKLLFVNFILSSSKDMPDLEFLKQTPVIMLNDNNWDAVTHLGNEGLEKPWLSQNGQNLGRNGINPTMALQTLVRWIRFNLHQQSYNQELIGDRIGITKYPTFVIFDTDNKMYFYKDKIINQSLESTNIGNFTRFVDEKKYLHLEPYDTPKEIDHFKKWLRRIFSLKMVPVYVVVAFYSSFDILIHLWQQAGEEGQIRSQKSNIRMIQKIIRVIRKGGVPQEKKRLILLIGQYSYNTLFSFTSQYNNQNTNLKTNIQFDFL
ncbi:unnamed protein product [Paramecium octaurelia]|uniref:Uncharacterized protein n=1 Tax=Paramecium octaurelia TaxID=43137 RepID=A0A8S1TVM1_PAROT|nr:unnamed protein product [Paramecium octaurelia]